MYKPHGLANIPGLDVLYSLAEEYKANTRTRSSLLEEALAREEVRKWDPTLNPEDQPDEDALLQFELASECQDDLEEIGLFYMESLANPSKTIRYSV